jgi:hypothetical protein
MFDEMKKTIGEKCRSVSTSRDGKHGLIQALCHSSVLVLYFLLEIQIIEE